MRGNEEDVVTLFSVGASTDGKARPTIPCRILEQVLDPPAGDDSFQNQTRPVAPELVGDALHPKSDLLFLKFVPGVRDGELV